MDRANEAAPVAIAAGIRPAERMKNAAPTAVALKAFQTPMATQNKSTQPTVSLFVDPVQGGSR